MNRICRRTALTLGLLALARVSPAGAAPASPEWLADSTTVDRWTLANGLEVVARHVPRAGAVSVTWGYRIGLDGDPADLPGWSSLLAEVTFTAPAGGLPERTRDEMTSLRPLGWSLQVNRSQTLFTEAAAPEQLAGLLHEVAQRMRGVQVTPASLRHALTTVGGALEERSLGITESMLYWQLREHAAGTARDEPARLAAARELGRVRPEAVRQALARAHVPANGVLALAGDFSGLDLRAILAALFDGLPAGEPLPQPPSPTLTAATVRLQRPGVKEPVGAVGLFAPALADTTHPGFYLSMLLLGAQVKMMCAAPGPPLETRFRYMLLDDPCFVRFYPELQPGDEAEPRSPLARLDALIAETLDMPSPPPGAFDSLRQNVLWLLGGPLPPGVLDGMRADPAALNVLSATTASRALWGDETFWSGYRLRFGTQDSEYASHWIRLLQDPRLRASLLVVPQR